MTAREPNTVIGIPEKGFREVWISKLWQAMAKTGRGYRRWTLKNQPPEGASRWRGERRADKAGTTKVGRFLGRFACPVLRVTEKSARRRLNIMRGA